MTGRASSKLPLNALRAFDAAARRTSFKAAASELGVTPAAISQQIRLLEAELGARLFDRLHRSLCLSPAGERLARSTELAFAHIDATVTALAAEGLASRPATLTISAAPSFATKWLARRLHHFQGLHGGTQIRLVADETLSDPGPDRTLDVAVRYGAGPYSQSLVARQLWPHGEIRAVCAPELATKLKQPSELLSLPLIRTAAPGGIDGRSAASWAAWFDAAGVDPTQDPQALARAPLMGTSQLALEAAMAGEGVALVPAVLVVEDLRAGRLAEPFQIAIEDSFCFWLLYRRDRADEAKIRAFAKWIMSEAADDPRSALRATT
jgi:DNA-binding transcriptional LysR family regulator